jgi:hypothetical protein
VLEIMDGAFAILIQPVYRCEETLACLKGGTDLRIEYMSMGDAIN